MTKNDQKGHYLTHSTFKKVFIFYPNESADPIQPDWNPNMKTNFKILSCK